jgi:D-alanine-D-alanine ligase
MKIALLVNVLSKNEKYDPSSYVYETINNVSQAIRKKGHIVYIVNASDSLIYQIIQIKIFHPDLIINLAERLKNSDSSQALFPELCKHLQIPIISPDTYSLETSLYKNLARNEISNSGILIPKGKYISNLKNIKSVISFFNKNDFPLIIKPNARNDSEGISYSSIALDTNNLKKKIKSFLNTYKDGILIEQYIEGVDVLVGYIEGLGYEGVIEPLQMVIKSDKNQPYNIFGYEYKNYASERYIRNAITYIFLKDKILRRRIIEKAKICFNSLKIQFFSRIDFRITKKGQIYFLENNASPTMAGGTQLFYVAYKKYHMNYPDVFDHLIKIACIKYGITYYKSNIFLKKFANKLTSLIVKIKLGYY